MARRKKKPPPRIIHLSPGALPTRLVADTAGRCLVFSDASCLRQGGLAAVFYASDAAAPQVVTRSVAAAADLVMHAVVGADFLGGHEFDGGTERIADRQADVGGNRAFDQRRPLAADAAAYGGVAGDQFSGPKHFA